MTLITLERIERSFGDLDVLTDASLRIDEGDRVGVVGDNGSGKTTMIRILAGVDEADRGNRNPKRNLRIAYAEQVPQFAPGMTVRDWVERGDGSFDALQGEVAQLEQQLAEQPDDHQLLRRYGELQGAFEAGGGYERGSLCDRVLDGVGFRKADYHKDVAVLSGGEHTRLVLAALMTAPADLLILDEPTNHLDLDGIDFVENFVTRYPGAVVAISHDRRFLNSVAARIVEVADGRTANYKGNYDAWRKQRDQQLLAEARAFKSQRAFIDKEMDFIRRNMGSRMTQQAKGRLRKLQRLERISAPKGERRGMRLSFAKQVRGQSGQTMLEAKGLALRIGDRRLVDGADFKIQHGETVALLGRNGSGKTTLMNALVGHRAPDGGTITFAHGLEVGSFQQDVGHLPQHSTVLDALRVLDPLATEKELRDHLALFLFSGDEVEATVADLSGGEKQRLSLARLTRSEYDCLLLDEPTNHLDIPGCEGLEEALNSFPGTVLLISHDRELLDKVADRVLYLDSGKLRSFKGGLDDCMAAITAERQARSRAVAAEKARQRDSERRDEPKPAATGTQRVRNPMMFARLEERIIELEEELSATQEAMTTEACYRDADKMKATQQREADLQAELAAAYERWENWQ